jgi:CheY-like chemotaxis protein
VLPPVEVLIIDDNPGDVALIRESFRECSVQPRITAAQDAEQAFELLEDPQRPPPTLVILDVNLPRTNGLEVLRRIRAEQRWNAVPVVIMSSSTMPDEVERAYNLHASAYIGKPSNLEAYFEIARGIVTLWLAPLTGAVSRGAERLLPDGRGSERSYRAARVSERFFR